MHEEKRNRVLLLFYVLLLFAGFLTSRHIYPKPINDERTALAIVRAVEADKFSWKIMEHYRSPMLPGFHFALGYCGKVLGTRPQTIRWVTFLHALLLIPVVILLARNFRREQWMSRSMQVLLVPWLPVMTWLVYTDVASMVWVMYGFYFWRKDRPFLSAAALTAACLVRQNNVVFAVAFPAIALIEQGGFHPKRLWQRSLQSWKSILPFLIPVVVAAGFLIHASLVLQRGSWVVAHRTNNPFRFHPTQIYFMTFVFLLLYAPNVFADLRRQIGCWRTRLAERKLVVPLLFAAAYIVYLFTIENTHPANLALRMMPKKFDSMYDADDYIILALDWNWLTRSIGFLGIWAFAEYFVERVRLSSRPVEHAGVVIASFIYLLPSWMVAFRYLLIPLGLYALSSDRPEITRRSTLVWHLTLLIFLATAFLSKRLFW